MLSINLIAILYLVSGIFFILALRGLSSPETSRTGNLFGMTGMIIAIISTLFSVRNIEILLNNIEFIMVPLLLGALVGGFVAARIAMTAMPQLVAGFHSLVGLAAVLIAVAVSNAESSQISLYVGSIAVFLAAINIFGGFLVTMRMLAMYKKGKKK